jgi:excinuclease UvrABC nuclease subunit
MTTVIEAGGGLAAMDAALAALPNRPAVFALWPGEGDPYLSKTALLRRRLLRLLGEREKPSRLLNLRHAVRRIEYQLTGSAFESGVLLYELTRRHFPESYLKRLNLRMPPYVNITLSNEFPRSRVTTHLTRGPEMFFGPFRSRASAERFEGQFLDLFQMRRCQEDLEPSPAHPGCIYGEMGMCVRPCQLVVGPAEYHHEAARVVDFLRTGGRSLLEAIARSRDRLSEEMMFEEAARQHKRFEKVQETLKLRDELARDAGRLNGVAITQSLADNAVELWFVRDGVWLGARRLDFDLQQGKPVSLDQKLREIFAAAAPRALPSGERREYLALLARWYYSTWRDGEWLAFESYEEIPYRKLVNAVSRVAHGRAPAEDGPLFEKAHPGQYVG